MAKKYIDIGRLRAEIEKLKEGVGIGLSEYEAGYHNGAGEVCNEILSVITSLQQEQPEKGLDVTEFCKPINPGIAKCVADHWWEMLDGKEPDKSLEEAAEESASQYYKDGGYSPFPNIETAAHKAGFIAGAEWMAKQGYSLEYVIQYAYGVSDTSTELKKATLSFPLPADIFEGDRVIIQIRKKNERRKTL